MEIWNKINFFSRCCLIPQKFKSISLGWIGEDLNQILDVIVKCILLSHLWLKLRTWIGNLSSTTIGFKNGHGQQYQMHGQQYQEYKENGDWEKILIWWSAYWTIWFGSASHYLIFYQWRILFFNQQLLWMKSFIVTYLSSISCTPGIKQYLP